MREADGLALSSRNRYLSQEDRQRALGMVTGLRAAWDAWQQGKRDPRALQDIAEVTIREHFDQVDYVRACDPHTLHPASRQAERILIACAAHLGETRLIDNVVLGEDRRP